MIHRASTLSAAFSRGRTSERAVASLEQAGARSGHKDRVEGMWRWLSDHGFTPCSMKTAAEIVTTSFGEHYFSAGQTNADVVRKRTAELADQECSPLRVTLDQLDEDGKRRNWYEVVK